MTRAVPLPGVPAIIGAVAGLLVWALHFGLVYVANAVACERGLAGLRLAGLPALMMVVLGLTALALAAVAVIVWWARGRLEGGLVGERDDDARDFTPWLAAVTALFAALAIFWQGVFPVLILSDPCG
ncbi:MAG: hypothetical protein U1E45_22660 [Geminicoccaceae bacterium]